MALAVIRLEYLFSNFTPIRERGKSAFLGLLLAAEHAGVENRRDRARISAEFAHFALHVSPPVSRTRRIPGGAERRGAERDPPPSPQSFPVPKEGWGSEGG